MTQNDDGIIAGRESLCGERFDLAGVGRARRCLPLSGASGRAPLSGTTSGNAWEGSGRHWGEGRRPGPWRCWKKDGFWPIEALAPRCERKRERSTA